MEHLINLNFAPGGLPATVHVSQYDDTIRQLRFQLWFGRSKVEVPSGASVRVDIKKPDGHIVLVNGTVNSSDRSIVTVPTTKQMTAVPGGSRGTLVVSSTGDKRISSAIFILQVHRDPVEDGDASDSDLSMLQDAIDQTAANASAAQAAATAAQQAASSFTTDTTLTVTGAAADAKKTGDEITALKADLAPLTSAKSALLECLKHAKFDEDGHTYYDALEDALFPSASLESITAVYNPGQNTIYDITPLSELKRYITVTGNYEGGESKTLTAYTLSGTLVPGTNTITISAGSVTTTISVTAVKYWTYAWSYADGLPGNNGLVKETTGTVTETLESDGVRVAVENTSDKQARYYYSGLSSTQLYTEGIFELEFKVNAYGSYSVAPYGNGVRLSASLGNRNGNSVNTAQLAFNTSGVLYVKTGTTNWTLLDNSAFELDTWYKVRIEQSLTKADVYVDGVFVGSIPTADNKESVSRPIFTAYRGIDVTFKAFRMRVA